MSFFSSLTSKCCLILVFTLSSVPVIEAFLISDYTIKVSPLVLSSRSAFDHPPHSLLTGQLAGGRKSSCPVNQLHQFPNNMGKGKIIMYSDRSSGPSTGAVFKKVATGVLGIFMAVTLVFGNELVGFLNQSDSPQNAMDVVTSSSPNTYPKLNKNEINNKLAQVPIFFIVDTNKPDTFYQESQKNEVKLFMDVSDAKEQRDRLGDNYRVGVTTLDEVFYPLVTKKVKIAPFLSSLVKNANIDLDYNLIPSKDEINFAKSIEGDVNPLVETNQGAAIPIFVADKIAFKDQRNGGVQIPLFLEKEDLIASWRRLRESSSNDLPEEPILKISTMQKIVESMENGSSSGKSLEFFPSIENLNAARGALGLEEQLKGQ